MCDQPMLVGHGELVRNFDKYLSHHPLFRRIGNVGTAIVSGERIVPSIVALVNYGEAVVAAFVGSGVYTTRVRGNAGPRRKTAGGPVELYAIGKTQPGLARTLDHALNPQSYIDDVVEHYGINLRGSGTDIKAVFDPSIPIGTLGKTTAAEGGLVIRIGPSALMDEATLANTIAHELSHARDYLRGVHKPHSEVYRSGDALEAWIKGKR